MSSINSQNDKLDLRRGFPEGLEMFDILEDPRSSNATLHPFGSPTFAWKADFRRLDTKVIRGVYETLHTEMSNWLGCSLPLRPNDRLEKDLEIDEEDLADIADFLAESCGRTFENPELNPFYNRVDTVSDLIEFFCAQPKLEG